MPLGDYFHLDFFKIKVFLLQEKLEFPYVMKVPFFFTIQK